MKNMYTFYRISRLPSCLFPYLKAKLFLTWKHVLLYMNHLLPYILQLLPTLFILHFDPHHARRFHSLSARTCLPCALLIAITLLMKQSSYQAEALKGLIHSDSQAVKPLIHWSNQTLWPRIRCDAMRWEINRNFILRHRTAKPATATA